MKDVIKNREILIKMIFRDFKAKYAGTALGIAWAIIQPAITVAIYVLVFSLGFKSSPVSDTPYFLWLVAAMVPWLFFNDLVIGVTSCLSEYSYLIKKTVFPAQILPLIKTGSAFIAHVFFILLSILAFIIFGSGLNIFALQILYYSLCTIIYGLGLGVFCAALLPYFRDITQVVGVLLQLSFWATPIAWDIKILPDNIKKIFMLNPLYYCVSGFRESFIGGVWFFDRPHTIYFFSVMFLIWLIAIFLFQKLKSSYADVL